jgi:hypothetical protein
MMHVSLPHSYSACVVLVYCNMISKCICFMKMMQHRCKRGNELQLNALPGADIALLTQYHVKLNCQCHVHINLLPVIFVCMQETQGRYIRHDSIKLFNIVRDQSERSV